MNCHVFKSLPKKERIYVQLAFEIQKLNKTGQAEFWITITLLSERLQTSGVDVPVTKFGESEEKAGDRVSIWTRRGGSLTVWAIA